MNLKQLKKLSNDINNINSFINSLSKNELNQYSININDLKAFSSNLNKLIELKQKQYIKQKIIQRKNEYIAMFGEDPCFDIEDKVEECFNDIDN